MLLFIGCGFERPENYAQPIELSDPKFIPYKSMHNLNRVTLMGNLAADPEFKETPTGKKVASFAVATNKFWKDKEGAKKSSTDFHRIVAWQRLGEICGEYLKKSSSVYLEGQLRNRNYETKEREKRYITEIIAKDVNILTWKKNKDGNPDPEIEPIDNENDEIEE